MRQLLVRIPDDLHTRLTMKARQEGVSVNAFVNRVLQAAAPAEGQHDGMTSRQHRFRERARELGVLVENAAPPVPPERFGAALEETARIGPVIDRLWSDGR